MREIPVSMMEAVITTKTCVQVSDTLNTVTAILFTAHLEWLASVWLLKE